MTTTSTEATRPALWVHDGGELACTRHGGAYLAAATQARPTARTHTTPLGTWTRVDGDQFQDMADDFKAAGLPVPACETCPTP